MEDKINEIYKLANGNTSCFIFLDDEDLDLVKQLNKEGYINHVKNSNKREMYVITMKLVETVEGVLDEKDIRKKQLKSLEEDKEEARAREEEELKNRKPEL
jgi:DNA-binding PadR family transcriptional regulator